MNIASYIVSNVGRSSSPEILPRSKTSNSSANVCLIFGVVSKQETTLELAAIGLFIIP
ncbi:hypothetical protein [Spiroplasma endosymbiont of Cantharis rufa]|uniref:hypothetical protein n=1 Tax=Spiroplasma endosymbiont of Cantharis rufa TaxID=3066279 RepID=UPI0030CCB903